MLVLELGIPSLSYFQSLTLLVNDIMNHWD